MKISYTLVLLLLGLGACQKKEAPSDDGDAMKAHPQNLVGLWRAPAAPLDAAHSTCTACDKSLAAQGSLRFAINEEGLPRVFGYSFSGQALKQGANGMEATAACNGAGIRERVTLNLMPAGIEGTLVRETAKNCAEPYAAQCACAYLLKSSDKISDNGEPL